MIQMVNIQHKSWFEWFT